MGSINLFQIGVVMVMSIVLFSCSSAQEPIMLPLLSKESCLKLEVYDKGHLVKNFEFAGDSNQVEVVQAIVNKKERSWKNSSVNYAPLFLIRTSFGTVNVQYRRIIVNYKDDNGKYRQLVTDLLSGEFNEIKSALAQLTAAQKIEKI